MAEPGAGQGFQEQAPDLGGPHLLHQLWGQELDYLITNDKLASLVTGTTGQLDPKVATHRPVVATLGLNLLKEQASVLALKPKSAPSHIVGPDNNWDPTWDLWKARNNAFVEVLEQAFCSISTGDPNLGKAE